MNVISDAWNYLTEWSNWTGDEGMLHLMVQQLLLTITALVMAMLVGLPIALYLGHRGRGGFLAINITNIGRAIPTFAMLALLVTADFPGTKEFGPYGRAGLATLLALALFALPPIITNSYVAVREVPGDVKQAADGMGMTGSQRFRRVELPLALPLVASGVRLALVQVWATATIAALVHGVSSRCVRTMTTSSRTASTTHSTEAVNSSARKFWVTPSLIRFPSPP